MSDSSDSQKKTGLLRAWHIVAWLLVVVLVGWWIAKGFSAQKTTYPNKPIEVVVPYPAGGGSDTFVRRVIQQGIEEGQPGRPATARRASGISAVCGSRVLMPRAAPRGSPTVD